MGRPNSADLREVGNYVAAVEYGLERLEFQERIRGAHHIFVREGVSEILNLQPRGRNAKPYQVKQVRNVILKYRLGDASEE